MSYVYMRALETAPERYDKGIEWLSWKKIKTIRNRIKELVCSEGQKVLEIGVGTAEQAIMFAKEGLQVVGIDHSNGMLAIAQRKLQRLQNQNATEVANRITLMQKAAVQLDEFPDASFDVVTATLVFSELWDSEQRYVLAHAYRILKPGGKLVLADEVVPQGFGKKILYRIVSGFLKVITYLLTQTTTRTANDLTDKVQKAGFDIESTEYYQRGAFQILAARKPERARPAKSLKFEPIQKPQGGLLKTFLETAARMVPHPTQIGLIAVNNPTEESPVLCTCNFDLTVRRLCDFLEKEKIDAWVLVAPTDGINVWCAACGDEFNAGSVITAIKIASLEQYVNHRTIILPQLSAPGVDPKLVTEVTGWRCVWGPVQIDDLPDFLRDFPRSVGRKTKRQRTVRFELGFRLESASVMALPLLFLIVLPLSIILHLIGQSFWSAPIIVLSMGYIYGAFAVWPWLPARLGTSKVLIWSGIWGFALCFASYASTEILRVESIFKWFKGGLSIFNLWPLELLLLILMIILVYDADGLTPTLRSSLLARNWNKGKLQVLERWGASYQVTPYGRITLNEEACTSCGICVDVCPMAIPKINREMRIAELENPETCVNCRACVKRCPEEAIFLEPETEAAKRALAELQTQIRDKSSSAT